MTATKQPTHEPLVSEATAAAWRRRIRQTMAPLPDEEKHARESPAAADAAVGSAGLTDSGFAESQQAALAAMVSIATAGLPAPVLDRPEASAAPPVPMDSDRPETSRPHASRHRRAAWVNQRLASAPGLSLIVILTVQACLSARLLRANTAFQDEALYLWAGRLEWAHWLHGTPIPLFPAYFSGAPIIYPPLGALANGIGGLVDARILSLCFMLGATTLLWGSTSRLFGRRAAFFAAGLWAVLGPTQFLGAFATFDAMSLFLIALATWCVIHGLQREDATKWMLGGAAALALANAAKYASALFDPVVIAIAVLVAFPRPGGKAAAGRGASIATYLTALLVSLATLGGGYYWAGITSTTLTRVNGANRATVVLADSWRWTGTIMVAAGFGIVLCAIRERPLHRKLLLSVLACASLLVPLEQAHIHTTTSLNKHVDFGVWFAAIAAGYAVEQIVTLIRPKLIRIAAVGACIAGLVVATSTGIDQAQSLFEAWPSSSAFITDFQPLVQANPGRLLVETASDPEYYLPAGSDWKRWSSTFSIVTPSGHTTGHVGGITDAGSPAVYDRYIARGYFSIVALNFQDTPGLDARLAADLDHNAAYKQIASMPYGSGLYLIWMYEPHRAGR